MDFLSGFSKRFSSAARSVSEKNRESAEQARISDELREATAELERLFADYGRACYVLRLGEGDRAAADDLVVRIRAAHARVDALSARRDDWRAPVKCAACGALMPRGARFCSNCGKRVENTLNKLDGVWATADVGHHRATVLMKEPLDADVLRKAVNSTGTYTAMSVDGPIQTN